MASQNYQPIRVNTLRGDLKIPFDVFLKIGEKYIHYCRSGSSFEGSRLNRLKAKKLRNMFIRSEDEMLYRTYTGQNIDQAYDQSSGKSLEIRTEVIQGFQQAESENYMDDPLSEFNYGIMKSSMHRFVEFLQREPKAFAVMMRLQNLDQSVTHHSVNVAAITIAMAADLQMKGSAQMSLLALGCMVHDIDHYYTNLDLTKPKSTLSKQELAAYKSHPINGGQRIQGAKFLDQLVVNLILQHEECIDGSGFPKGLYEKQLHPLVLIAGTANAYERMVSFEKKTPKDAVKNMMIDKMGLYPLDYLKSLQRVITRL